MSVSRGNIIRLPLPDHPDSGDGPVSPPRIIRGAAIDETMSDGAAPFPRVLRADEARVSSEPVNIDITAFEADYPLPPSPEPETDAAPAFDPDRLRAEIEAEWEKKLEDAVLRVREEAFEAGYGRAKEEMRQATEQVHRDLAADAVRMKESLDQFMHSVEVRAVELAVDAAEAALGSPLTDRARVEVERSLAAAVEELAGDGNIDVSLHPVDLLRIQESGFDAQLSAALPGLRWHPDDTLAEGDWSARSSQAVIRRVRSEMVDAIRTRLGIAETEAGPS